MGYYLRFVDTKAPLELAEIGEALRRIDMRYALQGEELTYGGGTFALLEINLPDDDLFDEEIEELREELEGASGDVKRVRATLKQAKCLLCCQALFPEGQIEPTLAKLQPLWDWLFANRTGLLQADAEGWYAGAELICDTG